MANVFTKRIVEDGHRNAVVELVGVLDTNIAAATLVQEILEADFTNNDPQRTLTGFRMDTLQYSLSDGMYLNFFWDATADEEIAAIAGRGRLEFTGKYGTALQPNEANAGYTGTINVLAYAPAATTTQCVYTVLVNLVKLYT